MYFYRYYPLWKAFFEELDCKVIVSPATNREIMDNGIRLSVDDVCLPVKINIGHVYWLSDKVDYLFMPRLISVSHKEYICPKTAGLNDMTKACIKGLPKMLTPVVNLIKSKEAIYKSIIDLADQLSLDREEAISVYRRAYEKYRSFRGKVKNGEDYIKALTGEENIKTLTGEDNIKVLTGEENIKTFTGEENIKALTGEENIKTFTGEENIKALTGEENNQFIYSSKIQKTAVNQDAKKVLLMGHPYYIFEKFAGFSFIEWLKKNGCRVSTPENFDTGFLRDGALRLERRIFWNHGSLLAGLFLQKAQEFDGILFITGFGCGIDSFVVELLENRAKEYNLTKTMKLVVDEHSGRAGLETRMEAFLDMLDKA